MLQTSIITSQTQCQTTPLSSIDTIVHFIRVCTHDCWHVCVKMPTAAQLFGWSHASVCVWKCWMSSERSQHLFLHPSLCFFFLKILNEKRMRNLSDQHFLSLRLFFVLNVWWSNTELRSHGRKMAILTFFPCWNGNFYKMLHWQKKMQQFEQVLLETMAWIQCYSSLLDVICAIKIKKAQNLVIWNQTTCSTTFKSWEFQMIKVNLKRLPCRIRGTGNFLRTFAVWLKKKKPNHWNENI